MSERDIERIAAVAAENEAKRLVAQHAEDVAEKVVARETFEAFERMGLLKDGRPDWSALAAPAKARQRQALWKERLVSAALPFAVVTVLIWVGNNYDKVLAVFTSFFTKGAPP